jgi:hypothetical protein
VDYNSIFSPGAQFRRRVVVTGCEVEASRSWVLPPGHGIMPWVRLVRE